MISKKLWLQCKKSLILYPIKPEFIMGKGDKKSKRGKIWNGSYGVTRPRKKTKPAVVITDKPAKKKPAAPKEEKPKTEKVKVEKPKAEKPKVEKPKAEKPKAEKKTTKK
jgi:30S ribosomal protein S31